MVYRYCQQPYNSQPVQHQQTTPMNRKNIMLVLAGFTAGLLSPAVSTPVRDQLQLTTGQKEFIRQFDEALGTNVLPVASTAPAVPIVKSAMLACGNYDLQREAIFALGGNEWQSVDAMDRFDRLFYRNGGKNDPTR